MHHYTRWLQLAVGALLAFTLAQRLMAAAPAPDYPAEISKARAQWADTSEKIQAALLRMRDQAQAYLDLIKPIEGTKNRLLDLEYKKKRELDEYRRGEFCTGCGQTRSEIEAKGEHFPHPGQSIRPATPEELEQCRKKWDALIAQARKELDELQERQKRASSEAGNAFHEFETLWPVYHNQILTERGWRITAWRDESGGYEQRLRTLSRQIADATTAQAQAGKPEQRQATQERIDVLRHLQATLGDAGRAAFARSSQDEEAFVVSVQSDLDHLGLIARDIPYMPAIQQGWFMEQNIRGCPPFAYQVFGINGLPSARSTQDAARSLLEGPGVAKPSGHTPAYPPSSPSARQLLEGK